MVKCKNKKALIPSIKAIVSIWNSLPSLIQLSPSGILPPIFWGKNGQILLNTISVERNQRMKKGRSTHGHRPEFADDCDP